ncbi:MAG: 4-(cytidine 5'-diphospho)-2-C-methyl-D-erythritol kinase [Acidobacteria bacterium]|nr:4-(cytidine 5'-diphospho)-2-C-methyl-D-erythritol kinase [Acidobacteriota bacterium]
MIVSLPSFAKINLGLRIGAPRRDGFHELRTVYQTIALHDTIRISVERGSGIEIVCDDSRVPKGPANTCHRMVECAIRELKARARVIIEIEKRLPVQGGLGAASGNAAAALFALERALGKRLPRPEQLRMAAGVGSDVALFLLGGLVLGLGRGEEVYPLPDLPALPCVIALPEIPVSTPGAFRDWDSLNPAHCHSESARSEGKGDSLRPGADRPPAMPFEPDEAAKLTSSTQSDRMTEFSREISAWLTAAWFRTGRRTGVSAKTESGGRAESPLLDLVRTGIENDFEKVVFLKHPELREAKRVLERAGAIYASLSGSGSTLYGLFDSREKAAAAARALERGGTRAAVTSTLTRREYWKKLLAASS